MFVEYNERIALLTAMGVRICKAEVVYLVFFSIIVSNMHFFQMFSICSRSFFLTPV